VRGNLALIWVAKRTLAETACSNVPIPNRGLGRRATSVRRYGGSGSVRKRDLGQTPAKLKRCAFYRPLLLSGTSLVSIMVGIVSDTQRAFEEAFAYLQSKRYRALLQVRAQQRFATLTYPYVLRLTR